MAREKSAHAHGFKSLASVTETNLPKPGSKLRACYDFLFEHRGETVKCPFPATMFRDLTDYYGCFIKKVGYRTGLVVLVGEWHGDAYSDYVSDKFVRLPAGPVE